MQAAVADGKLDLEDIKDIVETLNEAKKELNDLPNNATIYEKIKMGLCIATILCRVPETKVNKSVIKY